MIFVRAYDGYTNPKIYSKHDIKTLKLEKALVTHKTKPPKLYVSLFGGFLSIIEAKIWIAEKRNSTLIFKLSETITHQSEINSRGEYVDNTIRSMQGEINKNNKFLNRCIINYPEYFL